MELCLKRGISDATFYTWRAKYGGMSVSDARKLKALEDESRKLKELLPELMPGHCHGNRAGSQRRIG
jgi:putative transposase